VLDVRRLRVLGEVARHGSLSAAADALSYTTSAVSQHIAALEREAGIALVERRPRGVQLTQAGTLLVEHAAIVLRDLDAAEDALAELVELRRGSLRIASFATAGATILPRAVDAFRARHPAVDVTVVQATAADGVERVRQGRVDLALTVDQEPAPGLELIELFMDPFRLAVHRTHPLATVEAPRIAQLAGETWIDVPEGAAGGGLLAAVCDAAGIDHRVAYESDDYVAIHEMVGARLGIALVPDLALVVDNPDVVLRTLADVVPTRRIQAATKPAPVRAPAATAMLALLREVQPRRRAAQPVTASGLSR
jgi:molybdate transport repressor ModE-like protein